jgi:hypothetical protein
LFIKTTEIIEEIQPQLILFTGDLVNNFSNETLGWESFFKRLIRTGKVFQFSEITIMVIIQPGLMKK